MTEPGSLDAVLEEIDTLVDEGGDLEQGEVETPEAAEAAEPDAEATVTPEEPSGEDAEDTPTGEPKAEEEGEDTPSVDAESKDEPPGEPTEGEGTTQLFEGVDPETVAYILPDGTPVTVGEVQQGYLRHSDYTRKTQELAQQANQIQGLVQRGEKLVSDLFKSEEARGFLEEHPEALTMLLNNPDQTEALLANPEAFTHFWQQYDLISQDPNLAQALVDRSQSQHAVQQLELMQQSQAVARLGRDVAAQIEAVGKEFEGIDGNDVASYVLSLVGLTPANVAQAVQNPLLVGPQFGQLYQLLVRRDPSTGQEFIDTSVIKDRYTLLKQQADAEAAKAAAQAEQHNKAVQSTLEETPVTPTPDGEAPGTESADKDWEAFRARGGTLEEFLDEDPLLGV
jgi:hypothetical protein